MFMMDKKILGFGRNGCQGKSHKGPTAGIHSGCRTNCPLDIPRDINNTTRAAVKPFRRDLRIVRRGRSHAWRFEGMSEDFTAATDDAPCRPYGPGGRQLRGEEPGLV